MRSLYVSFLCASLIALAPLGRLLADVEPLSFGSANEIAPAAATVRITDEPESSYDAPPGPVVNYTAANLDHLDLSSFDTSCTSCGVVKCDCKKKEALKKAVAGAHKGVFYDNKFDYVCDPCYDDWWPGDSLKRMCLGDWGVLDVGGQYRLRQHSERHFRGLGLTGRNDDFLLHRTRLYANLEVGDSFRAFAEGIDAVSNYETFAPRSIEENRADFLNLFADVRLMDNEAGEVWARAGRQELLYGAQRLVSPLDWANTRRTFDGYKLMYKGSDWDVDAFYVRPLNTRVHSFDSPNLDQEFGGVYATYKKLKNETIDLYYLRFNNQPIGFQADTFGARYAGSQDAWLWELEAAYQGGEFGAFQHRSGAYTIGGGRKFDNVAWKPVLWAYYDWASGSAINGNGYNHLFPLAHKYLGFMDLFGRRNIEDFNFLLTASPHEKVKLLAWYHIFHLETQLDTPYNVNMTAFNAANAPGSTDLGQEIDLTVQYIINPRMDVIFGYSHFFAGNYYATTVGAVNTDADFYYTQFQFNF